MPARPFLRLLPSPSTGREWQPGSAAIEYEEREPILDPMDAVEKQSFVLPTETLQRGEARAALDAAPHRLQRRLDLGGQDQFYLEGHVAMGGARRGRDHNGLQLDAAPDEVQHLVADATGRSAKDVVCICRRMGGAFGGKESQAATIACIAALMATKTGRACKLRLDRDDDMIMTGKRHDFVIDYDVGFDDDGTYPRHPIHVRITLWSVRRLSGRSMTARCSTATTPTFSRTSTSSRIDARPTRCQHRISRLRWTAGNVRR